MRVTASVNVIASEGVGDLPHILLFLYRYVGLWALDPDSSAFSKCLYYVYNKLMLTIMFGFAATLMADIFVNSDDLSIASDGGCIFGGIAIVLYKVTIVQFRRERIERLLRETIESCHQLCKFSSK